MKHFIREVLGKNWTAVGDDVDVLVGRNGSSEEKSTQVRRLRVNTDGSYRPLMAGAGLNFPR